jgi:hypothetical protein
MPDCAESLCPTKRRPLRPDRVGGLSCNPWNNARRISMECEHRVSAAGELRRAYPNGPIRHSVPQFARMRSETMLAIARW